MSKNKQLKAASNQLKPVVMIGAQGLTESVHKEIDTCLNAHELIKIRINTDDKESRSDMINTILKQHDTALVNRIGHIAVFYRQNKEEV